MSGRESKLPGAKPAASVTYALGEIDRGVALIERLGTPHEQLATARLFRNYVSDLCLAALANQSLGTMTVAT